MTGISVRIGTWNLAGRWSPAHRDLDHRIDGVGTIDHIAVPRGASATHATRVSAVGPDGRLSDHDAYVVELAWCHTEQAIVSAYR